MELFVLILEFLGTFAFAISGIQIAINKDFDWFGGYVIGFVTAVGGGTLRDILLDVTPFWMTNPIYIICTGIALIVFLLYNKTLLYNHIWLFFDTLGLGLFTAVGVQKTLLAGFPWWVAIIMGCITGIAGGIIRDIFVAKIPIVFRRDIYALACIIGGLFYCILINCFSPEVSSFICIITILIIRYICIKNRLSLPQLNSNNKNEQYNK